MESMSLRIHKRGPRETETESLAEPLPLSSSEERMHAIEQTIDRLYTLSGVICCPSIPAQCLKAANLTIGDEGGNEVDAEFEHYALKRTTPILSSALLPCEKSGAGNHVT